MASEEAICNKLVRIWFSASNFVTIDKPQQQPPWEVDHFFEVQHVVDMLWKAGTVNDENSYHVPVGYWIDLSTRITGHQNLFQVNEDFNQKKKKIPWDAYAPDKRDARIAEYLDMTTKFNNTTITVLEVVQDLAVSMAKRTGQFAFLTRKVGQLICEHMMWEDGILDEAQKAAAGDNEPQTWQQPQQQ